jgi:hypothetical protein
MNRSDFESFFNNLFAPSESVAPQYHEKITDSYDNKRGRMIELLAKRLIHRIRTSSENSNAYLAILAEAFNDCWGSIPVRTHIHAALTVYMIPEDNIVDFLFSNCPELFYNTYPTEAGFMAIAEFVENWEFGRAPCKLKKHLGMCTKPETERHPPIQHQLDVRIGPPNIDFPERPE